MCIPFKAKEINEAFLAIDVDGSGEVDFEEFSTWYNETGKPAGKKMKVARYKMKYQRRRRDASGETDRQSARRAIVKAAVDKRLASAQAEFRQSSPVIDEATAAAAAAAKKSQRARSDSGVGVKRAVDAALQQPGGLAAVDVNAADLDDLDDGMKEEERKRLLAEEARLEAEFKANHDSQTQASKLLVEEEPPCPCESREFHYIDKDGNHVGPISPDDFIRTAFTTLFFWFEGQSDWMQVKDAPSVCQWMTRRQWFVLTDSGMAEGPMTRKSMLEHPGRSADTYVWRSGMDDWEKLGAFAGAK
jgi:hypothetical protein